MKKNSKYNNVFFGFLCFTLVFGLSFALQPANAEDVSVEAVTIEPVLSATTNEEITEVTDEEVEDILEVVIEAESDEEEEIDVEEFSDDELTEAEPSDLPEVEEDEVFTEKLHGKMLLDVEGNGEVYYVDPITGGKEYLADGFAAHKLLERRALGINEENFSTLVIGGEDVESDVCNENKLGKRLKGRIVLRVEEKGKAYWINPVNCLAYYMGTHEAAYGLMKQKSLGIKKNDLARVKNNKRQKIKSSYRYSLFAYAEDKDVDLKEAKRLLNQDVKEMIECLRGKKDLDKNALKVEKREYAKNCVKKSDIPRINKERRKNLKGIIEEVKKEREENEEGERVRKQLHKIDFKKALKKAIERKKEMQKKKNELRRETKLKKRELEREYKKKMAELKREIEQKENKMERDARKEIEEIKKEMLKLENEMDELKE